MTAVALVVPAEEVSAPPVHKYDFDQDFQTKIAAMTVRDGRFMGRTDGLILPQYFANQSEAALVNLASEYYRHYKRLPADTNIYAQLIKSSLERKTLRREDAAGVINCLKKLYASDISDREFVVDQVAVFARHQAVVQAMTECIGKLDMRDFGFIQRKMNAALMTGAAGECEAYNYKTMIDNRTAERKDMIAGHRPASGISTGYPAFDECLYHQGWGKGELSVIMGAAKAGKTGFLMQFGLNACTAGSNVLYVTLEVSAKILGARCDANVSNTSFRDLKSNIMTVHDKVKAWSKAAGNFIVEEYPTGTMTCSDLRRIVERWKARSITFDMIIVDYADIMSPERHTDSITENSKSVYVGLRAFAMQEQVAVLTATQTNREGAKAGVAKAEHVAEDFNKVRIADVIISINTSEDEIKNGEARLYFAACRNQQAGFALRISQDREKMIFIKTVLGRE